MDIVRDVSGAGWGEEVRGREEEIHEKKGSCIIHKKMFAARFVSCTLYSKYSTQSRTRKVITSNCFMTICLSSIYRERGNKKNLN